MVVGLTIILINRYFNLNYGLFCLKKSLISCLKMDILFEKN